MPSKKQQRRTDPIGSLSTKDYNQLVLRLLRGEKPYTIAKDIGISGNTIRAFKLKLFRTPMKKDDIILGAKTDPYYDNEDEIGVLPEYKANNRHLMTPIRSDWQLFTTNNTEQ